MPRQLVTKSQFDRLTTAEEGWEEEPDVQFSSHFLHLLTSADKEQLMDTFTERHCVPGEIVFRENDSGDTMYFIRSGKVAILRGDLNAPLILAFKKAGDIIGEMALLEERPRSATIVALDHLHLLGISRSRFHKLLQEMPSISLGIMEMLSSRLRKTNEALSSGGLIEKQLIDQLSALKSEKQRLEELQLLRQETVDLIFHDIRDPLSSIAIALKMLTLVLPEDVLKANQDLLDLARSSCNRLQRLVDSLLEVSRMEAGETQFEWGEVDLKGLIEEVVDRISIIERRGIDLQYHFAPDLPKIIGDQDKIERVLVNLMDNALKYTPEEGEIVIRAERQKELVRVSVCDTGPGVPVEERERIFRRFAQGRIEQRKRRGFGLGLAYCRLAIEAHGGRIWVESGEGDIGSCFIFTLPLKPPEYNRED